MKSMVQSLGYYTGSMDLDKIMDGQTEALPMVYSLELCGKLKYIADASIKTPMKTFHSYDETGKIINTYYAKGRWYFTQDNQTLKPLSELNSVFPQANLNEITFTAYYYQVGKGLIELVGVDQNLYVTGGNHSYQRVGDLTQLMQQEIAFICFTGSPLHPDYYAYKYDGSAWHVNISLNQSYTPTITLGEARTKPIQFTAFCPTGCALSPGRQNGHFVHTYTNHCYGFLNDIYGDAGFVKQETGLFHLQEAYKPEISVGNSLRYQAVLSPETQRKIILPLTSYSYQDTCIETKKLSYNNKQQLKSTEFTRLELNESTKSFAVSQVVKDELTYLWEESQQPSPQAAKIAIGFQSDGTELLSHKTRKITQGPLCHVVYDNHITYHTMQGSSNEGILPISIESNDGFATVPQERCIKRDSVGVPILVEGITPAGDSDPSVIKYIYTKGKARL